MNEVLHANIFFFITGIAVIVCTALLCVFLIHGIKVLKSLRRILDRFEAGTEVIAEDMHSMRMFFSEDGLLRRLVAKLMGKPTNAASRSSKTKGQEKRKMELTISDNT